MTSLWIAAAAVAAGGGTTALAVGGGNSGARVLTQSEVTSRLAAAPQAPEPAAATWRPGKSHTIYSRGGTMELRCHASKALSLQLVTWSAIPDGGRADPTYTATYKRVGRDGYEVVFRSDKWNLKHISLLTCVGDDFRAWQS